MDYVRVQTGVFNWYRTPPATFQVTLVKGGHPGYNVGATWDGNAPLIDTAVTQYGSVHPFEPGQYYKGHLVNNQLIYLSGQATGSTHWSSNFTIRLYDSNEQHLALMVNTLVGGTKTFPAPLLTGQLSGAPQRQDRTRQPARRLHLDVSRANYTFGQK